MGTYFYRLNTNNPVLKDVRVRKALAYSIDRRLLVDKVTKCGQIPAYSFTPPGSNGYQPETLIPFDPKLAKELLSDAGYTEENAFPKLEILFNTNEDHRKVALAIQQMWQQNLGISVELVNQDWKVYLSREMVGDFQVSRAQVLHARVCSCHDVCSKQSCWETVLRRHHVFLCFFLKRLARKTKCKTSSNLITLHPATHKSRAKRSM